MLGEQPRDGVGTGGGLDPPHRTAAATAVTAVLDVGEEHVPDEPAPAGARGPGRFCLGTIQGQDELDWAELNAGARVR
jgi:hypothetical protein